MGFADDAVGELDFLGKAFEGSHVVFTWDGEYSEAILAWAELFEKCGISTLVEFSFVGLGCCTFGSNKSGEFEIGAEFEFGNSGCDWEEKFVDDFLIGVGSVGVFFGNRDLG